MVVSSRARWTQQDRRHAPEAIIMNALANHNALGKRPRRKRSRSSYRKA